MASSRDHDLDRLTAAFRRIQEEHSPEFAEAVLNMFEVAMGLATKRPQQPKAVQP